MTIKNGDMPAMPVDRCDADAIESGIQVFSVITKREMMAMHMMAANRSRYSAYTSWESMASDAVEAADALLAELERTNGN